MIKINIKQHNSPIKKGTLDSLFEILVFVPQKKTLTDWPELGHGDLIKNRAKQARWQATDAPFSTSLPNDNGTRVTLVPVKKDSSAFARLGQCNSILKGIINRPLSTLGADLQRLPDAQQRDWARALVLAISARLNPPATFKSVKPKTASLKTLQLYNTGKQDFRRVLAEAEGNTLARALTALPANELDPKQYLTRIRKLAREEGWKLNFFDTAALKQKKAGAFLAVARGKKRDNGGIVQLSYTPNNTRHKRSLALVGKGICFDTGGMNLKPSRYMHGMHEDMEGSAVALGTLLTLTRLQVPFSINCWLAITENHIGSAAYKQNEVITAMNGTTIEIMHTDAEGRMVLADTLHMAATKKPDLLIDYATLTGSCVAALGTTYSGVFGNDEALLQKAVQAGRDSGERVWAFPHDSDYDDTLKSDVADIQQCTIEGGPDHILAARFLDRFVPSTVSWLHVDLSAGNNKGGLAHVPTDVTGFGVHMTTALVLDQKAF